jgi:tetraprenyl-beta-curcumene synthase
VSAAQALGLPAARSTRPADSRLGLAFAHTATRHLLLVLPSVTRELAQWRAAAESIPNPELRRLALGSLAKRGNIEGAALLAALAPPAQRRRAVRALVAYQTAYNYLDALAEQPSEDPRANNRRLHEALLYPFLPDGAHPDYYAQSPQRGDGGYLASCVEVARTALAALPSYRLLAGTGLAAARRIVDFQSLNLNERQGGHADLRSWAAAATPPGSGLQWWETAAAAGSSLAVHALIAAAANPALRPGDVTAIDNAYFPWAGALHSLLDSLVDRGEDQRDAQSSLLDYYDSPTQAANRLASLAQGAARRVALLPDPDTHRVIVTAMCSYYLSAPECDPADSRTIASALIDVLGAPLTLAVLMFRSRRAVSTLRHRVYV